MNETNPLNLVKDLRDTLQRYIGTTLPISRRYPELGAEFRKKLAEQSLVTGPFVEALPDFEKGSPLSNLLLSAGGFLHDGMGKLPHINRRLHLHQEKALTQAVKDKKSLLVATGTGSGKTETFLYPIVHQLLSDPEPDTPGVRALLIYPMNALANDQLFYRIAPLLAKYLAEHNITFGRYTGQVRANRSRDEEEQKLLNNKKLMAALDYPDRLPSNWLLTREEMLARPPKLLITNYAMLEHLLLLPRNMPLFARHALHTVVLDEIHSYSGAQATEVAFLLRKLKNRLDINEPLQVFGTSASLAQGIEADQRLIEFGEQLFGEKIHAVIRGNRVVHERLQESHQMEFSLDAGNWVELGEIIEVFLNRSEEDKTAEAWRTEISQLSSIPSPDLLEGESFGAYLERVMSGNKEIRHLAAVLDSKGVSSFEELAEHLFDDRTINITEADRNSALAAMIRIGMVAKSDETSFPLFPGRYHLAVNGIEGIAVRPAANTEGWEEIRVGRQHSDEKKGIYYPMLVCRRCGQPYIEAYKEDGTLRNVRPDLDGGKAERKIFWLGTPPSEAVDDEGDDQGENETQYQKLMIDPLTGVIGFNSENAISLYAVTTEHAEDERAWYVKKCPACGSRSSGAEAEILTRMHPGNEALASVATQRVLENLPRLQTDYTQPRPAFGRSLLTFSDSRQDAAFFAPYFQRTSGDIALRSAIYSVLQGRMQAVDSRQLAGLIFKLWAENGGQPVMLDQDGEMRTDESDVRDLILGSIGSEFCTPGGRRNSLEALGLVRVTYDANLMQQLSNRVRPLLPTHLQDAQLIDALLHVLLESVRREKALARFYGVDMRSEYVWGSAYAGHRSFELQSADQNISNKWLPPESGSRHNRRTWYLVEQLGMLRIDAMTLLRGIWDVLKREPVSLLRVYQPGFGLDGEAIRFVSAVTRTKYVCNRCGLFQQNVVLNKCAAFGCHGDVSALSDDAWQEFASHNHYLTSYAEVGHMTVRAREHTASLSTDLREQIEGEFAERKINVLSCTTTMEMGVDLGDLEAVINLNVPPGIANYQQRTGRAGRRAQAAPFCVTVAKNSQYDQAVYRDFPAYLKSSPGTPFVHLENEELFWRHQQSVLLSHLLRLLISDKTVNAPAMTHLFGDDFGEGKRKAFCESVQSWLESDAGKCAVMEAENLRQRLPKDIQHIGCTGQYLQERFVIALDEFATEVSERWSRYQEKVVEFGQVGDHQKAAYWQRLAKRFMEQFLVGQLSNRSLIPTYSFPVHSLTLEVVREQSGRGFSFGDAEIELSRDASLGISEYAPGSEVIANGRIWISEGLAQYPRLFMPDQWYIACPECFHVDIADTKDELPPACGNCGSTDSRRKRLFIEPRGFVTSYAKRKGRDPSGSRRRVKPADEARLIASPQDEQLEDTGVNFLRSALLRASGNADGGARGTMFVANRGIYGEGYLRCGRCNYTIPKPSVSKTTSKGKEKIAAKQPQYPHEDPLSGNRCPNTQLPKMGVDLVHQFDTDVRVYRFLAPLPECSSEEPSARRFAERVARTLAESCRLSATSLLEVSSSVLRATYRLFGSSPGLIEIVLYDAVPGGAGYCAKLGTANFSHLSLLQKMKQRLDCFSQCTNGCRQCLCDYANQRYWDSFERVIALEWVCGLLGEGSGEAAPGDFQPWKNPSLGSLEDRLANYSSLYLFGRQLIGDGSLDAESLKLINRWLMMDKNITILLTENLDKQPKSGTALDVYRLLYPHVLSGKLIIAQVASVHRDRWALLPRIFPEPVVGVPLFRQLFPHQPVLSGILGLGSSIEIGSCEEVWSTELSKIIADAITFPADTLREGERLDLFEFMEGQSRPIDEIFGALTGAHIERMRISDPFCGMRRHRSKLKAFVSDVQNLAEKILHIEVICREDKPASDSYEHRFHVQHHLEDLLGELGLTDVDIHVQGHQLPARVFHDREVSFEVVAQDGTSCHHRYFLTGGIDYLMDTRGSTRVIHNKMEK